MQRAVTNMKIESLYHTGLVVSDLDGALEFYTGTLGLSVERPVAEQSSEWIARVVGFDSARLRMAMVGAGGGHSFELIEYVEPAGSKDSNPTERNNVGAAHVGMVVDDVRTWYEKLAAAGVRVTGPPSKRETEYPWATYAFYFQDPDGNWLEMVERAPRPEGSEQN